MPFFVYSFVSEDGSIIKQMGSFDSVDELYTHIESRGGMLYRVFEVPSPLEGIYKGIVIGKAKLKDISEFVRGVAVYLESGISIRAALEDIGLNSSSKAIKFATQQIIKMLDDGYAVSEAFEKTGIFPKIVISMAKIGEATGELDSTLKDAADYLDRIIEIKSSVKRAMIYPLFSLFSILGAFVFWIVYILPKLMGLFNSFNMKLPLATRMLIGMSNFFNSYGQYVALVFVAIIVAFPFLMKVEKFRYFVHKMLWYMPIVGIIIRSSQMAFYFQYMALLTRSGVSITQTLETMEYAVTNLFFLKKIKGISDKLIEGQKLSDAVWEAGVFELFAKRMTAVGEETGNMDEQLNRLADYYYQKVRALVDVIGKLIEPVILIFIGVLFVFFVLALMSPIYNMIGNIGRY
ncbi:type II secretion system F family protein [Hippea jasoniae]|uniref:type II secretion system F family protein n=1 Tax=Hippea jasoniae TaxID=944479 RepID=UPI0005540B1F|nr:type II secretion system F family protein [Hippea jasoniae]